MPNEDTLDLLNWVKLRLNSLTVSARSLQDMKASTCLSTHFVWISLIVCLKSVGCFWFDLFWPYRQHALSFVSLIYYNSRILHGAARTWLFWGTQTAKKYAASFVYFTSSLVSPGNNTSIISDSSKRLGRRCNLSDTLQLISDCASAGELPYCLHLGVATCCYR
jgi:hypothetical protein